IQQQKISIGLLPPTFVNELDVSALAGMRAIITGGEAAIRKSAEEIIQYTNFYNAYGPTESSIVASIFKVAFQEKLTYSKVPIGKPIANTSLYVVDKAGQLVPVGVVGELWIESVGLARGYLNRQGLSEEKFVSNPFSENEDSRVYKTGDLVRWLPDGNIEYRGRKDNQVKIRGYRIETSEIEQVMRTHDWVDDAIVISREREEGLFKELIGYYVPTKNRQNPTLDQLTKEDQILLQSKLKEHLKATLPAYMIPALFIEIAEVPLTINGKVDKKALPDPQFVELIDSKLQEPRNDVEEQLLNIWSELLGIEKIGMADSFFKIGGHSLLAVRLQSSIKSTFSKHLEVADIFANPTIEQLAAYLMSMDELTDLPMISKTIRPEKIPLSYAQERLWFQDQLHGSTEYNVSTTLRLKHDLNIDALSKALADLVHRHEILRTTIHSDDGNPYQVVQEVDEWKMEYHETEDCFNPAYVKQLIEDKILEPFDLSKDFNLRASLIKCAPDEHILLLIIHHIASDGWSESILVNDLTELYHARLENRSTELPSLSLQYADYAIWERTHFNDDQLQASLDWWSQQLKDASSLELPTDYPRPMVKTTNGAISGFNLDKTKLDQLKALSLKSGASLFMTLTALLKVLLYRYSGQEDISIGTSLANRNHKEVESMVGFFINALVLRSDLSDHPTFLDLLERVKATTLSAFKHQHVPFSKIVDYMEVERSQSRNPLFQVLLVLQNTPDVPSLTLGNTSLDTEQDDHTPSRFDLSFSVTESPLGLSFGVTYATDLFTAPTIERMLGHFQTLLDAVLENPSASINQLTLSTMIEQKQIVDQFGQHQIEYEGGLSIVQLFEAQVAQTPNAIAIVFEEKEWTYQALNEGANSLASLLKSTYDIKAGDLIGMLMDASEWSLLSILAILKTGAAYVPIDLSFPDDRKEWIIKHAGLQALLVTSSSNLNGAEKIIDVFELDTHFSDLTKMYSGDNLKIDIAGSQLAYIIHTSGSTGTPKGVMVSHQNVVDYFHGINERLHLAQMESFGLMSSMAADLGNTVIFGALLSGGTLHLFDKRSLTDADHMKQYVEEEKIDCIKIVPSHWRALQSDDGIWIPQKMIIFGGEALSSDIIDDIKKVNSAIQLVNHYGPTETTIGKLMYPIDLNKKYHSIPIGKPFSNTQVYIVNEAMGLCPIGVPGELLIGGDGVALGYLKQAALTAEKFILNPFQAKGKGRLYKTGDLVKWLPDGNIQFLGRIDDQVKIRGYRVEPAEVENVLRKFPELQTATVISFKNQNGHIELAGYLVPSHQFSQQELLRFLADRLPEYMIPDRWIVLDQLPLNSNGKVNRKALPSPQKTDAISSGNQQPTTEIEKTLAEIWKKLLKLENVGRQDNFFEIGGNSLIAIRIISAVRKQLDQKPDLEDIFTYPTIEQLAQFLETKRKANDLPPITSMSKPDQIPLSFSQERLWFIDQFVGSRPYHQPTILRLESDLNPSILEKALLNLVDRHQVFRTVFERHEDSAYQVIQPATDWKMNHQVLNEAEYKEEQQINELIESIIEVPFDLSQDYMLRANLIQCVDQSYILVLVTHHIASDGWSNSVFVEDLKNFYTSIESGKPAALPPLPVQYVDYAIWQRQHLTKDYLKPKLNWWENQLANTTPLMLPLDFPRPAQLSNSGSRHSLYIESELTTQLNNLAQQSGATLFMTLLSAFNVLLCRYTGQLDISVGTPLANRNHKELESLVGFFINTLVLRNQLEEQQSYRDYLRAVKKSTLASFKNQEVPFEQIVDRVEKNRSFSINPLFQVMFVLQNTPDVPQFQLGTTKLAGQLIDTETALFDLTLAITEQPWGLQLAFVYNNDLFKEATIATMANHFEMILESIVTDPDQKIMDLKMLSDEEQQELLIDLNGSEDLAFDHEHLVGLFEQQVQRTPQQVAVTFGQQVWTYEQLDERANQLAALLVEKHHLQSNDLVGVMMERSDWMIVAILGILKAGGAYVPIDIGYPEDRKKLMMEASGIKALLFVGKEETHLPPCEIDCIAVDGQLGNASDFKRNPISPHDLAYVIYTSGTTGEPKGVLVEHQGVVNTIISQRDEFAIDSNSKCSQFFSLSFDASVLDIFTALLSGANLFILSEEVKRDPELFLNYINAHQLDVITLPGAYLAELDVNRLQKVKSLITGGEMASPEKVQAFLQFGNYFNSFGLTET
ncbi:MAG: amino acid adenylation domain-containing protein, partial [Bacteroidota bacterium]